MLVIVVVRKKEYFKKLKKKEYLPIIVSYSAQTTAKIKIKDSS